MMRKALIPSVNADPHLKAIWIKVEGNKVVLHVETTNVQNTRVELRGLEADSLGEMLITASKLVQGGWAQ